VTLDKREAIAVQPKIVEAPMTLDKREARRARIAGPSAPGADASSSSTWLSARSSFLARVRFRAGQKASPVGERA
jgi:hypothetical protein